MTTAKEAITRMLAVGQAGFARSPTVQPNIQKALHGLDQQVGAVEATEELGQFLQRSESKGVAALRRFELNRVLRGAWYDESFDALGSAAVERAAFEQKRSSDQAVIEGYLTHFPKDRPIMHSLARAARSAADRHDWAWRRRSEVWDLFDPVRGPNRVGLAVAVSARGEALNVLVDAGIGRHLAATEFGRSAFVAACGQIAEMKGRNAEQAQTGVLTLFDAGTQASDLPDLVRALLQPWLNEKPEPSHRQAVSDFLINQIGDPRIAPKRWESIVSSMTAAVGAEKASAIVQVFKRWLTDVAMREFFRAIAKTTDRPDQWRQRQAFWLAYLDADLVTDAWPALGQRARQGIDEIFRQSGERPEYGVMRSGPLASSTIIMKIGDVRIAEWSDNGSCRFWNDNDPRAPKLYGKFYEGTDLRTTGGRSDFEYHSHIPSPGWEYKFARVVYRRTGVLHPVHGRGH